MIRAYLEALWSACLIGFAIYIVIAFCAVGCMMNRRDHYTAHNVQGFRAPIASHLSSNN